ncbi:MAG: sulfatase-like hydrolase/transferase, partial [Opitutae bacterium]
MLRILFLFFFTFSFCYGAKRPNILFAFADDWGQQAGIYAEVLGRGGINDLAKTPNFDKLAKSGVLFTHAFVNAPSCTPCRSSILSGRNFWETGRGAILRGAEWDEKIPTWPLMLQKSGYHVGFTYKVWSPGNPRDAGIGGRANQYGGGRFNGFSQYVSAKY